MGGRIEREKGSVPPDKNIESAKARQQTSSGGFLKNLHFKRFFLSIIDFFSGGRFVRRPKIQGIVDKSQGFIQKKHLEMFRSSQLEKIEATLNDQSSILFLKNAKSIPQALILIATHDNPPLVFKNFQVAQSLLKNRIEDLEVEDTLQSLLQRDSQWHENFQTFLKKAQELENAKTELAPKPSNEQAEGLAQMQTDLLESPEGISNLLMEIVYLVTLMNTQEAFPDDNQGRNFPYLHTLYSTPPKFALLFENRFEEGFIVVTDPRTKETRTIFLNEKDSKETRENLLFQAINHLNDSKIDHPPSNLQEALDEMAKGNLYAINIGNDTYLSLLPGNSTHSILSLQNYHEDLNDFYLALKKGQSKVTLTMLKKDGLFQKEEFSLETEEGKEFLIATLKQGTVSYRLMYPFEEKETRDALVSRLRKEKILERDILLAKAFFIRSMI